MTFTSIQNSITSEFSSVRTHMAAKVATRKMFDTLSSSTPVSTVITIVQSYMSNTSLMQSSLTRLALGRRQMKSLQASL